MDKKILHAIIEKAIFAPSADNLQPIKFRLYESHIDLLLDSTRLSNFCDTGLLIPYLQAGMAIENIRIAATHYQYEIKPDYLPDQTNPHLVARIVFSQNAGLKTHLHFDLLNKRVTNRKFYNMFKKIPAAVFQNLEFAASVQNGFKLLWLMGNDKKYNDLIRMIGKSDRIRFENERLHKELFSTLRLSQTEALQTKDGLNINTLEAGPTGPLLFRLIASWKRLRLLNRFGMSRVFENYARLQMMSSQAAGVLVAPSSQPRDFILGGELMENLWHEINKIGLSLQPMEALPIFMINLMLTKGEDFTEQHKKELAALGDELSSLFNLKREQGIIMLFRMGYAKPPSNRSLRRPVESFIDS